MVARQVCFDQDEKGTKFSSEQGLNPLHKTDALCC